MMRVPFTYDFIEEKNNCLGGAISPGLRLRYESLHNYTSKLPLLSLEDSLSFIGRSTKESIHSGVMAWFINRWLYRSI
jgi:type III pantothenate kinase